jgi:hypothetical protein
MKNTLAIILTCFCGLVNAQIEIPRTSSAGSVTSTIGLTEIKIDYFRPKMKGRKIFGEGSDFLLPYGKIWRTGANSGTKITFSDDVKVEGIAVPKGTYLIFTWPGASEWSVSLYKDLTIGGNTEKYDVAQEQARFKVKADKLAEKTETLTLSIGDISDDNTTAKVQINWEYTSAKFTVVTSFDDRVMKSIEDNTKVNPDNLTTAAHYYFDTKKDLKQALKWMDQFFADGKNADQFWEIYFKAQIQKALGDKAGALATAQKSLDTAKKAPSDFGYIKQNEDLIKSLK